MNISKIIRENKIISRRYEKKYYWRIKKVLDAEVAEIINTIEKNGIDEAIRRMFNTFSIPGLTEEVTEVYREVGLRFASRMMTTLRAESRKSFGFSERWLSFIEDYLHRHILEKLTFRVIESLRARMLKIIEKSLAEGLGVVDIVDRMKKLPITDVQAARIVRTEITRASNAGSMAAGETFDYEQNKMWISAVDNRTRGNPFSGADDHANHWALHKTTIDYNDYFIDPVNGDRLFFPGDPNASAASVINCRCGVVIIPKKSKSGKLIPKNNFSRIIFA